MRILIALLISAVLCVSCVNTGTPKKLVRQHSLEMNVLEYVFSNEYISAGFLPEVSGLLSHYCYLPRQQNLMAPVKLNVFRDDLLPSRIENGSTGGRELLWGATVFHNLPMEVLAVTDNSIVLEKKLFGGEKLIATKTISIHPGESVIRIHFCLENPTDKEIEASLWSNLIARMEPHSMDKLLMPVKGGAYHVLGKGVTGFDKDAVFVEADLSQIDVYTVPRRPWLGRFNPAVPGVLVLLCDSDAMAEGARFYSYKRGERTMETISKPVRIAPGAKANWRLDYAFFPSQQGVRDVVSCYAIDRIDSAESTRLRIESCKTTGADTLVLDGFGEYSIPPLKPGKCHEIRLKAVPEDEVMRGRLGSTSEPIELTPLVFDCK